MRNNKGFTALEMAIVMVIIALVVVGVLAGRELIGSSKQTALLSQVRELQSSYNAFVLKYNGPPGDITNAVSYFGAANVRDGDGDGRIVYSAHETHNAFRELSLSGIYQKTTTDWDPNYPYFAAPGIQAPVCREYKKCMLSLADAGYATQAVSDIYGRKHGNSIIMEGIRPRGSVDRTGYKRGALTPADAQAIDSKMDDGGGHTGIIQAYSAHTLCGVDFLQYLEGCDDTNYYYSIYNTHPEKRMINLMWRLDN